MIPITGNYNTYVGARYVPLLAGTWDNTKEYEPLTIVQYEGASYTSKTFVPIGASITNEDFWVCTGNYNAQVEYYRQEVQEYTRSIDGLGAFINPVKYGAVLDGETDDTLAFAEALTHGSLLLPAGCSCKINNLAMPDFRTIDFNGSFVYTDGYAIKCIASNAHGYIRNIQIKNAHFVTPNVANTEAHTYGGIYLDGAIKGIIENCEVSNCYDGTDLAYVRNSFNISFNNVFCGTGNSVASNNSTGITFYCGGAIIEGTDNITNCSVSNALLQNIAVGITLDAVYGLIDSCLFENIGCSNVSSGIRTSGTTAQLRNIVVNDLRTEFSVRSILNQGHMSVNGLYATRMSDSVIENSGYLTLTGDLGAYNDGETKPLFRNTGKINASGCYPELIGGFSNAAIGDYTYPIIKIAQERTFTHNIPQQLNEMFRPMVVKYTTSNDGNSFTVPYPDGYSKGDWCVKARIYRNNNSWYDKNIYISMGNAGMVVEYPSDDATLRERPFEVLLVSVGNFGVTE